MMNTFPSMNTHLITLARKLGIRGHWIKMAFTSLEFELVILLIPETGQKILQSVFRMLTKRHKKEQSDMPEPTIYIKCPGR